MLAPAPLNAFGEAVLRERAMLALTDPDGEAEAIAPLSPARAWTILLDLANRPHGRSRARPAANMQRTDQGDLLSRIGADLSRTRGVVRCPAHDDRNPSLSWRFADGRVLVKCWAGCTFDEIRRAVAR